MQELQNGGVPPPESLVQQTVPSQSHQQQHSHSHKNMSGLSPSSAPSAAPPSNPKPKPTFRCDVCSYVSQIII